MEPVHPEPTPEPTQPTSETEEEQENSGIIGLLYRPLFFLRTAPAADKIVYDTTSAPVYEKETTVIYTGWKNTDKGKVDGIPGYVDMNISSI